MPERNLCSKGKVLAERYNEPLHKIIQREKMTQGSEMLKQRGRKKNKEINILLFNLAIHKPHFALQKKW